MNITPAQRVQLALRYPGVPVFRFGSPELEAFHKGRWSNLWGSGLRVTDCTTQYIVDHGNFLTLNTMIQNHAAVRFEDIELYEEAS